MPRIELITAVCIALLLTIACAPSTEPSAPTDRPAQPSLPPAQQQAADLPSTENRANVTSTQIIEGPPVQITLVHYRGTLAPLGCCNEFLRERDEYVAIQNVSDTPQDVRGWTLTNLTRGYPTFTFPALFPCIPRQVPEPSAGNQVFNAHYKYIQNPAESVEAVFTRPGSQVDLLQEKIDWSQCTATERLDETPLKPVGMKAAQPAPCILYPGQTVLVFTDEIHCRYGGFSFNYGLGNIWDNRQPDTAILYNEKGDEVSRRSYFTAR